GGTQALAQHRRRFGINHYRMARPKLDAMRVERFDIALRAQAEHFEPLRVAAYDIQRVAADSAGRPQNHQALHHSPVSCRPSTISGAAARMLSTRSSRPP